MDAPSAAALVWLVAGAAGVLLAVTMVVTFMHGLDHELRLRRLRLEVDLIRLRHQRRIREREQNAVVEELDVDSETGAVSA